MNTLKAFVTRQLTLYGWTALPGAALASKTYPTAVGPKEAHVYLADYGQDCEQVALQGCYDSEGRNCLEARGVLIPKKASAAQICEQVAKFVQGADQAVNASYAAKLYNASLTTG